MQQIMFVTLFFCALILIVICQDHNIHMHRQSQNKQSQLTKHSCCNISMFDGHHCGLLDLQLHLRSFMIPLIRFLFVSPLRIDNFPGRGSSITSYCRNCPCPDPSIRDSEEVDPCGLQSLELSEDH